MARIRMLMIALAVSAGTAGAAVKFSFDQSVYTVALGGTVDVPIYLQFTDDDAATLEAEGGLYSAGIDLARTNAGTADIRAFNADAPFDFVSVDPLPAFSTIVLQASNSGGVPGPRVLLGQFTFNSGAVAGDITDYTASGAIDSDPQTFYTVTWLNTQFYPGLDDIVEDASVQIRTEGTIIPLPAAAWMGLAFLGALVVRLARKRC